MGMSPQRTQKGFTIVEMLLASVISVMVIGGAYMVYDASQSTALADERKADLQQNARSAMDLLMWQIRLAGYLALGSTPNRIAIGTDTLLVIRGDVRLTGGAGPIPCSPSSPTPRPPARRPPAWSARRTCSL